MGDIWTVTEGIIASDLAQRQFGLSQEEAEGWTAFCQVLSSHFQPLLELFDVQHLKKGKWFRIFEASGDVESKIVSYVFAFFHPRLEPNLRWWLIAQSALYFKSCMLFSVQRESDITIRGWVHKVKVIGISKGKKDSSSQA